MVQDLLKVLRHLHATPLPFLPCSLPPSLSDTRHSCPPHNAHAALPETGRCSCSCCRGRLLVDQPPEPTIIQLLRQVQLLHVVQLDFLNVTNENERYAEGIDNLKHLGVCENDSQVVQNLLGNIGSIIGSLDCVDVGRRLLEQTHHAVVAVDRSTVGLYSRRPRAAVPLRALMSMVPLLVSRR